MVQVKLTVCPHCGYTKMEEDELDEFNGDHTSYCKRCGYNNMYKWEEWEALDDCACIFCYFKRWEEHTGKTWDFAYNINYK